VVSSGALLFYVLAPAHYPHLFWITDPITMVHAFMLTGITCWLAAARRLETKSEAPPYVIPLAGLLAAGWLAMKTKEPALAMPLALGLATLGSALRWKGAGKQILAMLAILGILVFLLVPIHHLGRASDENFIYNPQTIVRMLLRNFDCGYQDESASAFVSLERVWPVSVARTFGFFLLWTLAAAAVRRLRELRNRKGEAPADSRLLLRVFVCWLIVEIPWMGYFQPDPRYFSGTLIPLTALAAYLAAESLRASSRRFWTAALVFSLLWALAQNAYAIVWLRQKVGERTARFRGFAEALYTDQFGRSPSPEQLGRFYCAQYVPDPAAPRIADSLFYAGFGYEAWNRTPPGERDAAAFSRFAKEGAVYYAGDVPDPFPGSPILREVRRIECRNPESRIESLIHFLHPGPPVWFYLFKYQEPVHEPT